MSDTRPRWPNQVRAYDGALDAMQRGVKRLCITSPTGSGKSLTQTDILEWSISQGKTAALFTQRRLLYDQIANNLTRDNIPFGRIAAGHPKDLGKPIQLGAAHGELLVKGHVPCANA